jgi:hypothetical protein
MVRRKPDQWWSPIDLFDHLRQSMPKSRLEVYVDSDEGSYKGNNNEPYGIDTVKYRMARRAAFLKGSRKNWIRIDGFFEEGMPLAFVADRQETLYRALSILKHDLPQNKLEFKPPQQPKKPYSPPGQVLKANLDKMALGSDAAMIETFNPNEKRAWTDNEAKISLVSKWMELNEIPNKEDRDGLRPVILDILRGKKTWADLKTLTKYKNELNNFRKIAAIACVGVERDFSVLHAFHLMYLGFSNELIRVRVSSEIVEAEILIAAAKEADAAMDVTTPGGIDLNASHLDMQIKRDGQGVPLPLAQQDMAQLNRIQGFEPEILEIKPAINLPVIRELQQKLQTAV